MRPLSCLLSAPLFLLASSALAQTTRYPQPAPEPISTVQVTAPVKALLIFPDQAEQLDASYAMSNGWRMNVKPSTKDEPSMKPVALKPSGESAVPPSDWPSRRS